MKPLRLISGRFLCERKWVWFCCGTVYAAGVCTRSAYRRAPVFEYRAKQKNKSPDKNRSFHLARQEGLCPGAARTYRLTTFVAPSAKTVHRTVFFRHFVPPSSFEPLLHLHIENKAKKLKLRLKITEAFMARQEGLCPGAARTYRVALLLAPSAKTVHRTVFFRHFVPPSSFEPLLRLDI